jgi:hypothetical protein
MVLTDEFLSSSRTYLSIVTVVLRRISFELSQRTNSSIRTFCVLSLVDLFIVDASYEQFETKFEQDLKFVVQFGEKFNIETRSSRQNVSRFVCLDNFR